MRIFVTGGTGVLGGRVVPLLVGEGHAVTVLARTPDKSAWIERQGGSPAAVSLFDDAALTRAMAGHDTVLNLATHIPDLSQMARRSAWRENDRIRTEGSKAVASAATAAGVRRLVQESITMVYVDGGEAQLDESTQFMESAPATAALNAAESNAVTFGGDVVILRFGYFYGAGASHTMSQLRAARRGWLPLIGRPDAYQTYVHLDDAARAVVASLAVVPGTYNVTESEPATVATIGRAMARAVGRRALRRAPIPPWAVGRANRFLFNSVRVSNARFAAATSWTPRFLGPEEGWAEVARATADG